MDIKEGIQQSELEKTEIEQPEQVAQAEDAVDQLDDEQARSIGPISFSEKQASVSSGKNFVNVHHSQKATVTFESDGTSFFKEGIHHAKGRRYVITTPQRSLWAEKYVFKL